MANRRTDEEKLLELEQKMAQLQNQKKAIQARVSEKERKVRTKRLIETGAEVEAALGFSLDTPEARKALGDFLRDQEARGKYVTKWLEKTIPKPEKTVLEGDEPIFDELEVGE